MSRDPVARVRAPVVVWAAFGLLLAQTGARAATSNRIVAVVNDEVITEADVTAQFHALLEDPERPVPEDVSPDEVRKAVLGRLIEQRLILQEAKREGVAVTSDEVAERLEDMRSRFESDEAFRAGLADAGLSMEALKRQIREQLMIQALIDRKIRSAISVSPSEVARVAAERGDPAEGEDRLRASHLLVRVGPDRGEAQAQALIEELHQRLAAGEDFATLARRHSEDPQRGEGGSLGWVARGELLPELDEAMFSLAVGALSGPIRTKLGFHLVRVEERRSASNLTILEANQAIYRELYQQKFEERFTRWLAGITQRAYVERVGPDGR